MKNRNMSLYYTTPAPPSVIDFSRPWLTLRLSTQPAKSEFGVDLL